MAYISFTPASSTNLEKVVSNGIAMGSRWRYDSLDGSSLVSVSSYITDAYKLGMKVGDIVEQVNTSGGPTGTLQITEYAVLTVRATSASAGAGSADLSPGRAATS